MDCFLHSFKASKGLPSPRARKAPPCKSSQSSWYFVAFARLHDHWKYVWQVSFMDNGYIDCCTTQRLGKAFKTTKELLLGLRGLAVMVPIMFLLCFKIGGQKTNMVKAISPIAGLWSNSRLLSLEVNYNHWVLNVDLYRQQFCGELWSGSSQSWKSFAQCEQVSLR